MRVLSIDGGGIRGLIPALVLAEIEQRSGRRVVRAVRPDRRHLDRRHPGLRAVRPDPLPGRAARGALRGGGPEDLRPLALASASAAPRGCSTRSTTRPTLDRALERFLADKRLAETRPDLIVPAYNMGEPGPYFFKSRKAREEGEDFPLADGGARHLGGADLLRAVPAERRRRSSTAACSRPTRRCARSRRCCASSPAAEVAPAVARHRPAHAQAQLRGGRGLGPAGVGPADPRRGLRRGLRRCATTSSATRWTRPLLAAPGRARAGASDDLDDASEAQPARAARSTPSS